MNIVYTETRTITPDTFEVFTAVTGPRTVVWLVFGEIDDPETLTVSIYSSSDLVSPINALYLLEIETVTADPSNQRAFQSTPVPMVDAQWKSLAAVSITGGSTNRDMTVVAIEL